MNKNEIQREINAYEIQLKKEKIAKEIMIGKGCDTSAYDWNITNLEQNILELTNYLNREKE